ncbi:transmembrane protein 231 isoform X2 [Megachile rotundata]|uniref:transmembrane protein 231 isoform X2 n=1 Tax=Megachile rotundata TaxID=143995 RepID=UPI0006151930|nr:PREDICTED: transmembrane protein 231-like [Megachile rotundata]
MYIFASLPRQRVIIMMAAVEIFSSSVDYKYQSRICSVSFLIVLFLVTLLVFTPFFIIYNTGGSSLKNRVYTEKPYISFNYKYLILADKGYSVSPIVCSAFTMYKDNKITDDCTLIKVQEIDTNSDGKKDILKFEAHFYTNIPVKSYKILLFFNFQLKQLFEITIESIALFTHVLNEEVQRIQFFGDLTLQQKGLLTSEGLYESYNQSIEMVNYSLEELLLQNSNRKFAAKINNEHIIKFAGHTQENKVVICAEIIYKDSLIYYQPSILEELKWAWGCSLYKLEHR